MSTQVALTVIAICQLVMTFAGIVAVAALVYAIFAFKGMISSKIDEAFNRVQPVVDQAKSIAEQAKDTAEKVSSKVDAIMTKAEDTADKVGDRVQQVSEKVENAVNPQIVATAGVVGGALKLVQLYRDILKLRQQTTE